MDAPRCRRDRVEPRAGCTTRGLLGERSHDLVDVVSDWTAAAERLFRFVGVPSNAAASRFIERWGPDWARHTLPWRDAVSTADAEIVHHVLDGSPLERWWTDDQHVSDFRYYAY